jgi:predicted metalloprotease
MRTCFRWVVGLTLATTFGGCLHGGDPPDEAPQRPAPKAENLRITQEEKGRLRLTAVDDCVDKGYGECKGINGPLPGTYFGRQGDTLWAVASFRHPVRGVEGQPLLLTRKAGGRWRVADETGGTSCLVPARLARAWDLDSASDRKNATCFRTPRPRSTKARADDAGPSGEVVAAYRRLVDHTARGVDAYWSETVPTAFGATYVPPTVRGAYTSEADAPACGGRPVALNNAVYCRPDRFIAWDERRLMLPFFQRFGEMAPAMVIAHEFGHAVQDMLGWKFTHTIHAELNADCLAGAWARSAESLEQQGMRARELDEAVGPLFEFRDPEGSEWFDENAHGTALQRIAAFQHGTAGDVAEQCTPTPEHPAGFPSAPKDLSDESPAPADAPLPTAPDAAPEPPAAVP